METQDLLSIPEVARRLGISTEDAFDLAFLTRELPVVFRGNDHGVPQHAVEAYLRAHAGS
ncbi:MAG TPA: hypothetical protein VNF71_04200 [Acidimicrobiales bacterium]|nr:hypothetical protein [Acidimicrobiales bacterium]